MARLTYSMSRLGLCRIGLLVFLSCLISYFVLFSFTKDTVIDPNALQEKYIKLSTLYRRNLAEIQRHNFTSLKAFKYMGAPVSSVLKGDAASGTKPQVKRILAWTQFFGMVDWIPKQICSGDKTCISTTDKNDLAVSDGIVVHPRDIGKISNLPSVRLPHQRLIYLIQESPWSTDINTADYNGVFNWTSTYRRDSDIPYTFFWTVQRNPILSDKEYGTVLSGIMSSKTKLIAYMNSNCHSTHTKRMDFIKDLKQHIHIDLYGACGTLDCPRYSEVCTKKMSEYKFYLSLENTHCRDYLTEKVHQPLMEWHAVPIVMGGADPTDYETILPPNSYIHTSGFKSTQELADYLLLLDKTPELYAKYHAWRRTHTRGNNDPWCEICKALHNTSLPIQTYTDFKGWYNQDVCVQP